MAEGNVFYLKSGDTYPSIFARLEDSNGAVDLSGVTDVKFRCSVPGAGNQIIFSAAVVVYPSEQSDPLKRGIVRYDWEIDGSDTTEIGNRQAEWVVTFASGRKATFPRGTNNPNYNEVNIQPPVT